MITRRLRVRLLSALQQRAAVVLIGPRQVGKTTLAQAVASEFSAVYLDLEAPSDARKIEDPEFYFHNYQDKLIVIDEVQRRPDLFQVIRSQIDQNRRAGRRHGQFLLLGSASNDLLRQSSESLAGRVSYQELFPFDVLEVGSENASSLWLRGGFPDAWLEPDGSLDWRLDFIRTYLERDVPALGLRIPAETLRRFWTMLAHHQGQLFNASRIGASLGVKGQTASRYLDLMSDLMLVRRLRPWHTNVGKRLVKSPKTYVRDAGILHALLNLRRLDDVLGHPVAGASWEGFVIENLIAASQPGVDAHFYRTQAGAEIDLLLQVGSERWAIEIKRNSAPSVSRGFHNACEDLQPDRKWVIYPGEAEYELKDAIVVAPLGVVMEQIRAAQ